MNTHKRKITKPASNDPVREALGHPSGPGLMEMLNGKEDEKLQPGKNTKKEPEDPNIPII
jgi:Ribonuclease G/E